MSPPSAPGAIGLPDGKRATTHWKVAGDLAARCSQTRVEPYAVYVRDGTTYTSAGVAAGSDLALALVEEDHGPELSRDVARALVVHLQRPGGQSQLSAPLPGPPPRSSALRRVADPVLALDQVHTGTQAAALAGFPSYESLRRIFVRELSVSPAAYQRRFATARGTRPQR